MPSLGAAYVNIRGDMRGLKDDLNKALDMIKGVDSRVEQSNAKMSKSFQSVVNSLKGLTAAYISFYGAIGLARGVFEAGKEMDRLQRAMQGVYGTASLASKELEFLSKVSERLGLNFKDQIEGYMQLSAAARGTSLEGEKLRKIYEGLATAATAYQMTQENVSGMIYAVVQMMSKAVVTSEELKRQMGDRLYGAFQLATRAMGLTVQELNKLLKTGELLSDSFLPKFFKQILKELGPGAEIGAKSLSAEVNRLTTAWFKFQAAIMQSKVADIVVEEIKNMTSALKDWQEKLNDPGTQLAIKEIATGIKKIADFAVDAATEVMKVVAAIGKLVELRDKITSDIEKHTNKSVNWKGLESEIKQYQLALKYISQGYISSDRYFAASLEDQKKMVSEVTSLLKPYVGKIDESTKGWDLYAKASEDAADETGGITTKIKELTSEQKRLIKQQDEYLKNLRLEIELIGLDEASKERLMAREKGLTGAKLAQAEALITQKHALESAWNAANEANDAIAENIEDGMRMAQDAGLEVANIHEKAAEASAKEWEHFLERVQDATADTLYDMFDGAIDGWDDLLNRMGDLLKRALAEWAAQALLQPVIVPIVQSLTGGAQSGASSFLGGSSNNLLSNAGSYLWNNTGLGQGVSNIFGLAGAGSSAFGAGLPTLSSAASLYSTGGSALTSGQMIANSIGEITPSFGAYGGVTAAANESVSSIATFSQALSKATPYLLAFSAGSMGYSTIGDMVGLPQGEYSGTTAGLGAMGGMALGAKIGSGYPIVGTIVGAIVGGIAGSLFNTKPDKKRLNLAGVSGYDSTFDFYDSPGLGSEDLDIAKWGETSGVEILDAMRQTVIATVSETKKGLTEWLSSLPEELSSDIEKDIALATVDLGSNLSVTSNRGQERLEAGLEQIAETTYNAMIDAITPIVENSISEYLATQISDMSGTIGMLDSKHMINKYLGDSAIFNADYTKAEGADFGDYTAGTAEVLAALEQIQGAWDAVSTGFDRMIEPLSSYKSEMESQSAVIDQAIAALENLGFNEAALTEAREKGALALEAVTKRYADSIDEQLTDSIAKLVLSDSDNSILSAQKNLSDTLAAVSELGEGFSHLADKANVIFDITKVNAFIGSLEVLQATLQDAFEEAKSVYKTALSSEIDRLATAQTTLENNAADAKQAYIDSIQREISAKEEATESANATVEAWGALADNLRETRNALFIGGESALNPLGQSLAAKEFFQSSMRGFFSGDYEKASELPGAASDYLSAAKASTANRFEYADIFAQVQSQLLTASDLAEARDIKPIDEQTAINTAMTVEELQSLYDSLVPPVLTMQEAADAYHSAQLALDESSNTALIEMYTTEMGTLNDVVVDLASAQSSYYAAKMALDNSMYATELSYWRQELALLQSLGKSIAGLSSLAIPSSAGFADGGIATGPVSGHWELLHGDELIVPLNNIRHSTTQSSSSDDEEIKMLLRELIALNKNNSEYSRKLYRVLDRVTGGENSLQTRAA